ncbi:hypothetical protein GCM10009648_08790 [Tsukamurella spumae]
MKVETKKDSPERRLRLRPCMMPPCACDWRFIPAECATIAPDSTVMGSLGANWHRAIENEGLWRSCTCMPPI